MVVGGDVTPAFGQQEKLVDGISLEIGGSASITAVAAARLGLRGALAAAGGGEPAGRFRLGEPARGGGGAAPVAGGGPGARGGARAPRCRRAGTGRSSPRPAPWPR